MPSSSGSRLLQRERAQFTGAAAAALAYRALHAHFLRRLALAVNKWEAAERRRRGRRWRPATTIQADVLLKQAELLWRAMHAEAKRRSKPC